jgi:membrane-associated phospholipid phosphatase
MVGIWFADEDDFTQTVPDRKWKYLGSPSTNLEKPSFTPGFPAYPSGHAVIGTAAMTAAQLALGISPDFSFTFVSAELDGIARDPPKTTPRPRKPRKLTIASAILENQRSRVYLGVHWNFDSSEGAKVGADLATKLVAHFPARVPMS